MGEGAELYGAVWLLPMRLRNRFCCQPSELVRVKQPGYETLQSMPNAVDGTCRHEASFIHCTLRGTSSSDHLSSWCRLEGNEERANLYAATWEVNLDQQMLDASVVLCMIPRVDERETLFSLCANGKKKKLNGQL